jgi:hypothetical protein
MELSEKPITFQFPAFIYLCGQSNNGKTYFVSNGLIPKCLEAGFQIHWVVNKAFDIEKDLAQQALDSDKIFIHRAKDLSKSTIDNLLKVIKANDKKKLVIVDNFTYEITLEFLDYITFARKYNASTLFISHTLFANSKISPRLRELVSYFIFFYMPISDSYKKILDNQMFDVYRDEIGSFSYKFLIIDLPNSVYSIGKLPEYPLKIKVKDQRQTGKLAEAIRSLEVETGGTQPAPPIGGAPTTLGKSRGTQPTSLANPVQEKAKATQDELFSKATKRVIK